MVIFELLLKKEKEVLNLSPELGITNGDADADFKITKICTPYCPACSRSHPLIFDLLKSNASVKLQIIFSPTHNNNDLRNLPIKHFMAIASQNDEQLLMQALDDWYLPEKKDYVTFAKKYEVGDDLSQQDIQIDAMRSWCINTQIEYTPTFFVSKTSPVSKDKKTYQLPDIYDISDLEYLLYPSTS